MLGGEDLGGGQEGGLPAASDHLEHGAQGHEGLTASHVALKKALHGNGAGQVGGDLLTDPLLPGGQVVGQAGVEVRSQGALRLRYGPGDRGACRLMMGSTLGQGDLQDEGLLVAQPFPGGFPLPGVLGPVHPAVGGVGVDQLRLAPQLLGEGVGDVARLQLVQDAAHRLGHQPGREGLRAGVDGHGSGQQGLALVLIELVEDVQARVGQLLASTVESHLAAEQDGGSGGQLGGSGAHLAGRTELDEVHGGGAVGDGGLHEGRDPSGAGAPGGGAHDLGLDGGLFALDEGAHVSQLPPRIVAPGQQAQQVRPGLHPLLGELCGRALAHEPGHGTLEQADAAGTGRAG